MLLPPSKRRWIHGELQDFQQELMSDIAYLLNHGDDTDLVEAFCSSGSMLTKAARQAGMEAERWTIYDYGLSTEKGYTQAEH